MSRSILYRLVFVTALASGAGHAAEGARLVVAHGIRGKDIGMPKSPDLPVDVLLNGKVCLLKSLAFGTVAGPVIVPAGRYAITVSLADRANPCGGRPVVKADADLAGGSFSAVVAALSPKNAPKIDVFPVESFPIQQGAVSFLNANASDGPVSFTLQDSSGNGYTLPLGPGKFDNTKEFGPATDYRVTLTSPGDPSAGPFRFSQAVQGEALLFAVGSAESGTLTLLVKNLQFR